MNLNDFGSWLRNNWLVLTILLILFYIPLWFTISIVYQIFDSDYISFREFIIIQIITILFSGIFTYLTFHFRGRNKGDSAFNLSYTFKSTFRDIKDNLSSLLTLQKPDADNSNQEEDLINLPNYGMVRPCCYNAARLHDAYCLCGRAIPEKLRLFLKD